MKPLLKKSTLRLRGLWAKCYGASYRISARNIFKVYRT